jgi:hypothetical protein
MIRRDTRRRLDQFIANPACRANVLSAVHDISMAEVARALGLDPEVGQSPFAIGRGATFERALYAGGAARLFSALVAAGVLPASASGFVDLRLRLNGGPITDLDQACARFADLLRRCASARGEERAALPAVVAQPALRIPGRAILPDGMFAVDVVTVHPEEAGKVAIRVGEIKVYPDRGGHTDAHQLAATRAQAGIYVHALRLAVAAEGVGDGVAVADDGFLVLTRPGSSAPSVRAHEDFGFQARRAESAFERLREAAALADTLPRDEAAESVPEARLAVVRDAPKAYDEACISFCELSEHCHAAAVAAGDPVILGRDAARFFGPVSLDRAAALLDGAPAESPIEEDLVRRVREARGLWYAA